MIVCTCPTPACASQRDDGFGYRGGGPVYWFAFRFVWMVYFSLIFCYVMGGEGQGRGKKKDAVQEFFENPFG